MVQSKKDLLGKIKSNYIFVECFAEYFQKHFCKDNIPFSSGMNDLSKKKPCPLFWQSYSLS